MIPEAAVEAAWATFWDVPHVATSNVTKREIRIALEAAAPYMRPDFRDANLEAIAEELATPLQFRKDAT